MAKRKKAVACSLFDNSVADDSPGDFPAASFEKARLSQEIESRLRSVVAEVIGNGDMLSQVRNLNTVRKIVCEFSPFKAEPVDFVEWVPNENVRANDYNPNSVAPPEMELLRVSIMADGYTQPIVTNEEDPPQRTVVDGFHRNRVGKECEDVRNRVHGFLPVVQIRAERTDTGDRMASTIRHNRARGKHRVDGMSDIVVELKRRNWSNERIARDLGMDQDEILRLCQITGLTELFSDQQFSKSWDVEGDIEETDFVEITDDVQTYGEESESFRTVNTSDENRIFHTFDKWECHKAGFYKSSKEGWSKEQCWDEYKRLLTDIPAFSAALARVIAEWKHSCEHYLTNTAFNRIAWLGQAAVCIASGVPSEARGGFSLLSDDEKKAADQAALECLNKWLVANGLEEVDLNAGYAYGRQSEIY